MAVIANPAVVELETSIPLSTVAAVVTTPFEVTAAVEKFCTTNRKFAITAATTPLAANLTSKVCRLAASPM